MECEAMQDWNEGIKIAITAIVIVVIIGLVFGFLYMTLNANARSQERLASNLTDFDRRAFDQYDQTEITGSQVIAAIKQFRDQPIAVLVETRAEPGRVVNYNATIGAAGTAPPAPFSGPASAAILPTDDGNGRFVLSGNRVVWKESQNYNTTNTTRKSSREYINPAGKFAANIVYDDNSEIIALYLRQTR